MGQKFEANATLLLNNQIQSLIRQAIDACGAKSDCLVKSTGDGAILQFESPTVAEHFAIALHQLTFDQHCKSATSAYEWRSFRVGIFSGEVVLSPDEIAGAVVGFAARLEAAAGPGEIVIDVSSWAQIPPEQQALYGPKEVLQVKPHDPIFEVHRRRVVASPIWQNGTLHRVALPTNSNAQLGNRFSPRMKQVVLLLFGTILGLLCAVILASADWMFSFRETKPLTSLPTNVKDKPPVSMVGSGTVYRYLTDLGFFKELENDKKNVSVLEGPTEAGAALAFNNPEPSTVLVMASERLTPEKLKEYTKRPGDIYEIYLGSDSLEVLFAIGGERNLDRLKEDVFYGSEAVNEINASRELGS